MTGLEPVTAVAATGLTAADIVPVFAEIINGIVVPVLSGMILTIHLRKIHLRLFESNIILNQISSSDSTMGLVCFLCDRCCWWIDLLGMQRSEICH